MSRKKDIVTKLAIHRIKSICGFSDILQFPSIEDLVHFFTLHSFGIGVKLKEMNVTEHYQLQQQQHGSPVCSDSQVSEAIAWCRVQHFIHCSLV